MRTQDISACIHLCFMAVPISYQQCLTQYFYFPRSFQIDLHIYIKLITYFCIFSSLIISCVISLYFEAYNYEFLARNQLVIC